MIWLSLPLGLLSWLLPVVLRNKKIKPTAVSAASLFLCILVLLNVLWELYRRTVSGDHSALLDLTPALAACSAALVIGTLLLNLWLHAPRGILRYLDRPIRCFVVLLVTLVVQSVLYIPGMLLTALLGDRLSVGSEVGAVVGLTAYVGAVPLLRTYWKKTPKERLSWGLPLGVLLSRQIWSIFLSITYDILAAADSVPYEFSDAHNIFLIFYLVPMVIVTLCLVGKAKWDHWKQRRAERIAGPKKPRRLPRVSPFWAALILQTVYFMGVSIYAAYFGGHVTGYHLGTRSGLLGLALALVLLIVYRVKKRDEELSLHVPGAVLVFPALELLFFYLPMVLPGNKHLPYEYGSDFLRALFFCYYLPTLLLSVLILNIWPIVKDNLRDWVREKKAAPKPRILPFLTVLLLQTMVFLPAPLLAVNGGGDWTGYRMGVFYCSVPLGLAVVLLAVYLHKVPKEKLSFGVPLAVAAFLPVQYLLQSIPVLLGVQADVLPYEWDQFMNAFYPIYYLPVLLMSGTGVGILKLQLRLRRNDDTEKGGPHEPE